MSETYPVAVPRWTLPDRLRKARETAGFKQAELADRIGVARASIVNYETGRTRPSRPVLLSWALATAVPVPWLAAGDDPKDTLREVSEKEDILTGLAA